MYTASVIVKGNRLLAIINMSFDTIILPLLYKSLVRPVLEYANAVWGPFFSTDQIMLEKVQRRTTRIVSSIRHLPYDE